MGILDQASQASCSGLTPSETDDDGSRPSTRLHAYTITRLVQQLWLFWLAPILGAVIAGFVYRTLLEGERTQPEVTGRVEAQAS